MSAHSIYATALRNATEVKSSPACFAVAASIAGQVTQMTWIARRVGRLLVTLGAAVGCHGHDSATRPPTYMRARPSAFAPNADAAAAMMRDSDAP